MDKYRPTKEEMAKTEAAHEETRTVFQALAADEASRYALKIYVGHEKSGDVIHISAHGTYGVCFHMADLVLASCEEVASWWAEKEKRDISAFYAETFTQISKIIFKWYEAEFERRFFEAYVDWSGKGKAKITSSMAPTPKKLASLKAEYGVQS